MPWGPTQARNINHIVTSAEATAGAAEWSQQVRGRIRLLLVQAWNETTPWKFMQIGVYAERQPEVGLPLNTGIQPSIRIPVAWVGDLDFESEKIYATVRDPVAADACVLRFIFQAWLD